MDELQQQVIKDPRVQSLRQQYNNLITRKNKLIMEISNIEADIIKNMGSFEAIAKTIATEIQDNINKEATSTPPVPAEKVTCSRVEEPCAQPIADCPCHDRNKKEETNND